MVINNPYRLLSCKTVDQRAAHSPTVFFQFGWTNTDSNLSRFIGPPNDAPPSSHGTHQAQSRKKHQILFGLRYGGHQQRDIMLMAKIANHTFHFRTIANRVLRTSGWAGSKMEYIAEVVWTPIGCVIKTLLSGRNCF